MRDIATQKLSAELKDFEPLLIKIQDRSDVHMDKVKKKLGKHAMSFADDSDDSEKVDSRPQSPGAQIDVDDPAVGGEFMEGLEELEKLEEIITVNPSMSEERRKMRIWVGAVRQRVRLCVLEVLHDLNQPGQEAEFDKILAEMKKIDDQYKGSYESTYKQFVLKENEDAGDGTTGPLGVIKALTKEANDEAQRVFDLEWKRKQWKQQEDLKVLADSGVTKEIVEKFENEAKLDELQRRYEDGAKDITAEEQEALKAYKKDRCFVTVR